MSALVVTVAGIEPEHLISRLADLIRRHGGNWLDCGISRRAGRLAAVIVAAVDTEQSEALADALLALASPQLTLQVERLQTTPIIHNRRFLLDLLGHDRPGIVSQITALLAETGVTIVQMETECYSGSMSAEPMFHAEMVLDLPEQLDPDTLRIRLEQQACELMVEIDLLADALSD